MFSAIRKDYPWVEMNGDRTVRPRRFGPGGFDPAASTRGSLDPGTLDPGVLDPAYKVFLS